MDCHEKSLEANDITTIFLSSLCGQRRISWFSPYRWWPMKHWRFSHNNNHTILDAKSHCILWSSFNFKMELLSNLYNGLDPIQLLGFHFFFKDQSRKYAHIRKRGKIALDDWAYCNLPTKRILQKTSHFRRDSFLCKEQQLLNWLTRIDLDFHPKRNHFFFSVVSIFFLFCLKVPNHWDNTLNYLFLPDLHFPIETHYRAAGRKEKEKRSSKNALLSPSLDSK